MMDFLRDLWNPIAAAVWGGSGALSLHLWRRFRERVATLRWTGSVQSLAASGSDEQLGEVQVLYNGNPVENLFGVTINVLNDTSRDLEDLEIQIGFRDGTTFLSGSGSVAGALRMLGWSNDFVDAWDRYIALPAEDQTQSQLQQLITNRFFQVPVLNRGEGLNFAFLVHAPAGVLPRPIVNCQQSGVRLKETPPRPQLLGVPTAVAGWVGLLLGVLLMAVVVGWLGPANWLVLAAFVVGAFAQLIGVAVVKLWRLFVRLLS